LVAATFLDRDLSQPPRIAGAADRAIAARSRGSAEFVALGVGYGGAFCELRAREKLHRV